MKRLFLAATLLASLSATAADVGVSIRIGEPGFYGQIDIGGFPRPQLIYAEPLIIERGPYNRPPVYLHVPPGHAKNWGKHCARYNACGERVYFVRGDWYERTYVPQYRERHHGRPDGYRDGRGKDRGDDKRDKRDKRDRGDDDGRGHGQGRGRDR